MKVMLNAVACQGYNAMEVALGYMLQVIHFTDAFIQSDLQVVHTIET